MTRSKSVAYSNPNPDDKDAINRRIAAFQIPPEGLIVLLDDIECASSNALIAEHGPSIRSRIRLPQHNTEKAALMRQGPFAEFVVDGELQEYMDRLPKDSVALLYADFCGGIEQLYKLLHINTANRPTDHFLSKFVPNAYIAITICMRSYEPVRFTNQQLYNLVVRPVQEAVLQSYWLFPDENPDVYGVHARMATQYFFLWGEAEPDQRPACNEIPEPFRPINYCCKHCAMCNRKRPLPDDEISDCDSIATTAQYGAQEEEEEWDEPLYIS